MVVFDDMELDQKVTIYDKAPESAPTSYGEWLTRSGDVFSPKIPHVEPLKLECQAFLDLMDGGGDGQQVAADGLKVVRTLERLQASLDG
jgi:predicted dehydrogenase